MLVLAQDGGQRGVTRYSPGDESPSAQRSSRPASQGAIASGPDGDLAALLMPSAFF